MSPSITGKAVRSILHEGAEIALIDIRPEPVFAAGHPLWAASLPLGRLELEAWERLPRCQVTVVLIDGGDGAAEVAAFRLARMGYEDVRVLEGGVDGWADGGGELFLDVNVPSKAFAELVESVCATPSLAPQEVAELLKGGEDVAVVDVRRFDEYRTMSIPGAVSAPGGELVHRISAVAPDPTTLVVVNCAGRTRSIIGTQSLRNARIPNRIAALRNGTIGWSLAGLTLDHGRTARAGMPSASDQAHRTEAARAVALGAGARFVGPGDLAMLGTSYRTVYRFDVRDPAEFEAGHPEGFVPAPGGQLVQETDHAAPVRGARIVLAGDGTARAPMTASWLAQMGWEVVVVDDLVEWSRRTGTLRTGPHHPARPEPPAVPTVTVSEFHRLQRPSVIDVAPSGSYAAGHIPGARWSMREGMAELLESIAPRDPIVVTSPDGAAAAYAVADVLESGSTTHRLQGLLGGTDSWRRAGLDLEVGTEHLPDPAPDSYRRPYEGTSVDPTIMQAYLDWEYGLVAQLGRDGTHHFTVWQSGDSCHL
jgi:rhodanese-related sulfurtransferase